MPARAPLLAGILASALALAGCQAEAPADALYPLTPGLRWVYAVDIEHTGRAPTHERRVMENVDRVYFAGEDDVAIRRNDQGTRYYVARRADGLYRVAVKWVVHHTPIMDQPAQKILPLPVTADARWRESAHTYMLDRARPFVTQHAPGNAITLDYRIENTRTAVDVPAGHFERCVHVVGETTFKLGADVGFAATEVPIVQQEWYCPGVGLTRLIRDEHVRRNGDDITGGRMTLALEHGP